MTDALPTATTRLSPLELASGAVWGTDPEVAPLPPALAGLTARAALEDVVRRALRRPPCVVSFSGGRDSSAVLALAMHVARRDGLPLPIPVTTRFPRYARANEDEWQELVIRHLGVSDWTCLVFDDELDIVGPYARRVLAQHGLLWPANAHAHLPIAEQAACGSLLTGVGGDELLSPDALSVRVNQVLMRQVAPRPRDVLRIGAFYAPRAVRRMAMRRRSALIPACPWLTPAADRVMRAGLLDDAIAEPLRWDESLDRGWWRSRYRRLGEDSLRRVAAMCGGRRVQSADRTGVPCRVRGGGRPPRPPKPYGRHAPARRGPASRAADRAALQSRDGRGVLEPPLGGLRGRLGRHRCRSGACAGSTRCGGYGPIRRRSPISAPSGCCTSRGSRQPARKARNSARSLVEPLQQSR